MTYTVRGKESVAEDYDVDRTWEVMQCEEERSTEYHTLHKRYTNRIDIFRDPGPKIPEQIFDTKILLEKCSLDILHLSILYSFEELVNTLIVCG